MKKIDGTKRYEEILKQRRLDTNGLPIRQEKKKTRLYIDNEYFKKSYAAKFPKYVTLTYLVLAMHANHKYQTCFPSIETLMKFAGTKNRNSIVDAIKILEAFDIISVDHSKGRRSNSYILLKPDAWRPVNSIEIDTVKRRGTVSNNSGGQYQKALSNSMENDTRSHIKELSKRNQSF